MYNHYRKFVSLLYMWPSCAPIDVNLFILLQITNTREGKIIEIPFVFPTCYAKISKLILVYLQILCLHIPYCPQRNSQACCVSEQ